MNIWRSGLCGQKVKVITRVPERPTMNNLVQPGLSQKLETNVQIYLVNKSE